MKIESFMGKPSALLEKELNLLLKESKNLGVKTAL
jgi:hypothetical protein